jgi:hypothetical protein
MESHTIRFPDDIHDRPGEIEAKGYLGAVQIIAGSAVYELEFYDEVRLAQAIADDLRSHGFFSGRGIVVVPRVTREAIERAVACLSRRGFVDVETTQRVEPHPPY